MMPEAFDPFATYVRRISELDLTRPGWLTTTLQIRFECFSEAFRLRHGRPPATFAEQCQAEDDFSTEVDTFLFGLKH